LRFKNIKMTEINKKTVVVYGGCGSLGKILISEFKKQEWKVLSIDLRENKEADANFLISSELSFIEQSGLAKIEVKKFMADMGVEKVNAIVCVAGGWKGGSLKSKALMKNCDLMWNVSVQTSLISSQLAALYMETGGTLILPGAHAAFTPTPRMIGYGIAKAAIHHLVKSCAAPKSGMPKDSATIGMMPIILDTPYNREMMTNADYSTWTPLPELSKKIIDWCNNIERPASGSLIKIETKNSITTYESF